MPLIPTSWAAVIYTTTTTRGCFKHPGLFQTPGAVSNTRGCLMPNHEKWADFTSKGTVAKPHKQHGRWQQPYAQFECPYECGDPVELPAANVKNSKATKCHEHLMVCTGTASDGKKAHDDPRVRDARRVAAQCAAHMQAAKRGRTGDMIAATDVTLALREQITTLTASETRLVTRNDELHGRVHSLETQMQQLRFEATEREQRRDLEMQQLRNEMQQLRQLVPLVERITSELGLVASVPPAAPVDAYVGKIARLKTAAAVAKTARQQLEGARVSLAQLNRRNHQSRQLLECFSVFGTHRNEARAFLRAMAKHTHPDKHGGTECVTGQLATGLQQALNLVRDLISPVRSL